MSAMPQMKPVFDFDAYLAWEAEQPERHEFVAGEVFAMTRARSTHIEGVKVRVEAADAGQRGPAPADRGVL